ncbi:hypothetical protein ACFFGR_02620 [Arthrobacter liuii]|uniref:Uncharacterized protein n=1 Tax=Arthrobacter liuii TaxID=1476996 RepID=A0ABQ2AST6_9MICC|nr:hypothetical protein [Arthrobacter liuii]GGH94698.1 hypothetical protein GCM10007170_18500 [Arthrobacter liuii]
MATTEIFMRSLSGGTPETTEALWLDAFLVEIQRQAELGSRYIKRAWTRAMAEGTPSNDTMVWGDLQAALFAAIVVQRILQPGPVRQHPRATKESRQQHADYRGSRLRELLRVDDSWPLFLAKDVRDACEHFDEKLDAVVLDGMVSLVDWHISHDGKMLQTPPRPVEGQKMAADLRCFYPRGGLLRFSARYTLDIFNLDVAFLNLLEDDGVERVRTALREGIQGPMVFGSTQYVYLMSEENEDLRVKEWMDVRETAGVPVPRTLGEVRFRRET